ncbi:hypothetical protein UFOVP109_8 [uncultured Caudovirales phage]|uniref:Uncharacterized protein n=1 Tax=uncultured Caudovirales phage TaxID=2100421 RepID=A0A6J7WMF3_9CAUD|nr:hypothetical protein UFOVP109_8 [uncultured Caudovirales phage]CAB5219026.1 hypothetical protein UFOVP224_21 [uncultured Caudovirales phage]
MILAIDGLAERYGVLPSEVMHRASTFDIYVLNTVRHWNNRQAAMREAGVERSVPHLSQDELQQIMTDFKEQQ